MKNITFIPKIEREGKPRVCAYVRVSTGSNEQLHSFGIQKEYWDNKFVHDDSVEYQGMFCDEGISGYKTHKRKGFMKMLELAEHGKIDTVYTKSFSRFCRNEADGLEAIEVLRKNNVNVIFEKEELNTADPNSRFILNIMAKVAEDSIVSTSNNIKMALRQKIQEGLVFVTSVYGYYVKYDKESREYKFSINYDEAKVVKEIFKLYISGIGCDRICSQLEEKGIKSPSGKDKWNPGTVSKILFNEKYIGDVIQQKSLMKDFRRVKNESQYEDIPLIKIENAHEPIITKEDFQLVKDILEKRKEGRKNPLILENYAFTGKIKCIECGGGYIHRTHYYNGVKQYDYWACGNKIKKRQFINCSSHSIKDDVLKLLFIDAYKECSSSKSCKSSQIWLEKQMTLYRETESNLNIMRSKKYISKEQFEQELDILLRQINDLEIHIAEEKNKEKTVLPLRKSENTATAIKKYLDKVIVNGWTVTFIFINGYQTDRRYTNGTVGGQKGNKNTSKNKK